MALTKTKSKSLLLISILASIIGSHYVSYKFGSQWELEQYESLSKESNLNVEVKPLAKTKEQSLFELLPLKCNLGPNATFAVGRHKGQPMYAIIFKHPMNDTIEYMQLKRNQIRGRGYELVAKNLSKHLNVSVDYEVTPSKQFYITLNHVKYITDKRSYSYDTVKCGN